MNEQIPFGASTFGTNSFAENPEPRLPSVLLLDISGSMAGAPIAQLTDGLAAYRAALSADKLAAKRVEVAVVTFGGTVQVAVDFTTAEGFFFPPVLIPSGETPMGAAIVHGIEMLRHRKEMYKAHGISYFRPWLWLVTDGEPTDSYELAAERVRQGEATKEFAFFAVGVQNANFDVLKAISRRTPMKLQGLQFREMFLWLSNSQASVSRSAPGETVPLTNPAGPEGWACV